MATSNTLNAILNIFAHKPRQAEQILDSSPLYPIPQGPLISRLEATFTRESLKKMAEVCHNVDRDERNRYTHLKNISLDFFKSAEGVHKSIPEQLAEVLGSILQTDVEEPEDGPRTYTQRTRMFNPVKRTTTLENYAMRVARMLIFAESIEQNQQLRSRCGIRLSAEVTGAVRAFRHNSSKGAMQNLLIRLANQVFDYEQGYNHDLLCSFAVAQMVDKRSGRLCSKEVAQKSISALKYALRLAVLQDFREKNPRPGSNLAKKLIGLVKTEHGGTKAFDTLSRLHRGIIALPRATKPRVCLRENPDEVVVDGVPCSFKLINKFYHRAKGKVQNMLAQLLMGFEPQHDPQIPVPSHFISHFALGKESDNPFGGNELLQHVASNGELMKLFFSEKRGSPTINKSKADAFLKKCMQYEDILVGLFHILSGCSSRATDYASLTFRNGEAVDQERSLSYYNSKYLVCVNPNSKNTLLKNSDYSFLIMLPTQALEPFIHYWKYVRPFACTLLQGLKRYRQLERWQRYCFVKGNDQKYVRKVVSETFVARTTHIEFQRLRHIAAAMFQHFVMPLEYQHKLEYPTHVGFGHSARTDQSYGVEFISGSSPYATVDTTATLRVLKRWWTLVDINNQKTQEDDNEPSTSYSSDSSSDGDGDGGGDKQAKKPRQTNIFSRFIGRRQKKRESTVGKETPSRPASGKDDQTPGSPQDEAKMDIAQSGNVQPNENEDQVCEETNIEDIGDDESNRSRVIDAVTPSSQVSVEEEEQDLEQEEQNDKRGLTNALKDLGYNSFKSKAQEELVKRVVLNDKSVLGVLPTGGGKSLAIYTSLVIREQKLSICVVPLLSLLNDIGRRLQEIVAKSSLNGNVWATWTHGMYAKALVLRGCRLVLVSAEQAKSDRFHLFLRQADQLIRAIIFDEAPLFVSSHYRRGFSTIPLSIRALTAAKFVLLSATVPVDREAALLECFGIPNATIVRMCTVRPNIAYVVQRFNVPRISAHHIQSYIRDETGQCIIFVRSVSTCEALAKALNQSFQDEVSFYHARLNHQQREIVHRDWLSQRRRIMVATTAFAFGIDSPECTCVVHVEGSYNLETFCQESGRAGRRGQPSKSIVMLSASYKADEDDGGFEMFVESSTKCRRLLLSEALDPPSLVVAQKTCGACDTCRRKNYVAEAINPEWQEKTMEVHEGGIVTPAEERSIASKRLALARRASRWLRTYLDKHKLAKGCFLCLAMEGKQKSHDLGRCSKYRARCFRCGDKHKRASCPVEKVLKKSCEQSSLCVTCGLPVQCFGTIFHEGTGSMGRGCKYKDTTLPLCMFLWHSKDESIRLCAKSFPANLNAYVKWLCTVNDSLSNAAWLLFSYLQRNKSRL